MFPSNEEFLATIEAFLKRRKMAPTRFGILAAQDPAFVIKLRKGRTTTLDRARRVYGFMAEYDAKSPAGAAWPPASSQTLENT